MSLSKKEIREFLADVKRREGERDLVEKLSDPFYRLGNAVAFITSANRAFTDLETDAYYNRDAKFLLDFVTKKPSKFVTGEK